MPELRVGVPFPRVAIEILRYAVGDVAARRLVPGAQTQPPAGAAALGLVDGVVGADELLPRAVLLARELATGIPPDAFAATKVQLRRDSLQRVDRYGDETEPVTALWNRRATDGGTQAYLAAVTRK